MISSDASARSGLNERSPRAWDDLASIWNYTEENWGVDQAERYIRDIHAACESLDRGIRQGRSADDIRPGYRKLAVGAHILFYKKQADGLIDVVRILHQKMDISARLAH